jgi:hypothetical protein
MAEFAKDRYRRVNRNKTIISRKAAKSQREDGFKEDHADVALHRRGIMAARVTRQKIFLQKLTKETKVLRLKDLLRQLSGFPFVAFCFSSISLRLCGFA